MNAASNEIGPKPRAALGESWDACRFTASFLKISTVAANMLVPARRPSLTAAGSLHAVPTRKRHQDLWRRHGPRQPVRERAERRHRPARTQRVRQDDADPYRARP